MDKLFVNSFISSDITGVSQKVPRNFSYIQNIYFFLLKIQCAGQTSVDFWGPVSLSGTVLY
jgi:hypothetical protein